MPTGSIYHNTTLESRDVNGPEVADASHVIRVEGLRKYFPVGTGLFRTPTGYVRAVDGVSLRVGEGETLGLVGESGSGKSTVGRVIAGLLTPTDGRIYFKDQELSESQQSFSKFRRHIQMVFQDPGSSLNPRRTIRQTLMLPLKLHQKEPEGGYESCLAEIMDTVELPRDFLDKLPRSMSGGQRQRVAIARALACDPTFIVLDEPTSALDVSVQAKIIKLLLTLQEELSLAYLFISHDLSLMRNVASRTAVMYLGKIVETGSTPELFKEPLHPYTQLLLASIPVILPEEEALKPEARTVEGEIPSPMDIPGGCSFRTRCPHALSVCAEHEPPDIRVSSGHVVRCHLYA